MPNYNEQGFELYRHAFESLATKSPRVLPDYNFLMRRLLMGYVQFHENDTDFLTPRQANPREDIAVAMIDPKLHAGFFERWTGFASSGSTGTGLTIIMLRNIQGTHAMALTGVNVDEKNKPISWQVENSWWPLGDGGGSKRHERWPDYLYPRPW